jgi:hypothetical protein
MTIEVQQYRSPYFSADGYADDIIAKQPRGWYAPGDPGLEYLAAALGAVLGRLSTKAQQLRAYNRIQACTGSALDSWARDYLGGFITRIPGESDTAFRARVSFLLSGLRLTLQAIQTAVRASYTPVGETFTVDSPYGIIEVGGFFDVTLPIPITITTYVYDRMTDPVQAALHGIHEPEFVIHVDYTVGQSELGWLDYNYMDFDDYMFGDSDYSPIPYDANLGTLIEFVKANGTIPIYGVTLTVLNT